MYRRILVPLDGSATAERGLGEAIDLARDQGAALHLLYVLDPFPPALDYGSSSAFLEALDAMHVRGERMLAQARKAAADAGVAVDSAVKTVSRQDVAGAIADHAQSSGCDLVVMGTHGRRGASRLALGSRAEEVMRTSPVPVLGVRHDGHSR